MTSHLILRVPFEPESRFDCIGRYGDGNQFMAFVTGAFPGRGQFPDPSSDWQAKKSWNAVIHKFDSQGNHLSSQVKLGGHEKDGRDVAGNLAWQHLERMLHDLGLFNPSLCDIHIKPFSVEVQGVYYELEYVHEVDEENGDEFEHMMLWPNDVMFHPPWDSGNYST